MNTPSPVRCRAKDPATCKYHGTPVDGATQFAVEYAATRNRLEETLAQVNWHDRQTVLFNTPHGSRLYGLAHANSDEDYFIVYPPSSFTAKQSIVNNIDATRMSFNYFTEKAAVGSHQALEAMFSREATVDQFAAFRAGYHAEGAIVAQAYLRTIRSFAMGYNYKRRRHGLRLALNLNDLLRYGRFNPTLNAQQVKHISEATNEGVVPDAKYLDTVRAIVPYEITWDFEHEGQSVKEHIAELYAERTSK